MATRGLKGKRLLVGAACCIGVLAACEAVPTGSQPLPSALSTAPTGVREARRPSRRYAMNNVEGRCEMYWLGPASRSVSRQVRCPRDLASGETIRLAGRSCFRETAETKRRRPVRCPSELLSAEAHRREGKGEWLLKEAPRGSP